MRKRQTLAERRRKANASQKAYRLKHPLTAEQKARARAQDKIREQTPEAKAKAAAKYQRRKEAEAGRPRAEKCECCGELPGGVGRASTLNWEHCHVRGTFRGWVCSGCNLALGHALDRPDLLRRMADYLEAAERSAASPPPI